MTQAEWDQLSDLLVKVADLPFPTWKQKQEEARKKLSPQGVEAIQEIASWGWEF